MSPMYVQLKIKYYCYDYRKSLTAAQINDNLDCCTPNNEH